MGNNMRQFHSVEFALDAPQPLYQFRIWRSVHNDPFLLVKKNSKVLSGLKVGHIMPMKYYSSEALQHFEIRSTQIRQIVNEKQGRFRGHYRIEIDILSS
jgi:hypothetical protein